MHAKCYELDEASMLAPCSAERTHGPGLSSDAVLWLDLQGSDETELGTWLDRLGVRGLSRRIFTEARQRPGFYPLKDEVIVVLPVALGSTQHAEREHVVLLCRKNLMLTVHASPVDALDEIRTLEDSEQWLAGRSVAALASALIYTVSEQDLIRVAAIRDTAFALAKRMDRDPGSVSADDVLDLRAEVLGLGAVVGDQVPQVQALRSMSRPFFDVEDARTYLQISETNIEAAERGIEWVDQQVSSLRSGVEMFAQEKTNRRLNTLTLVTAVIAPASLLTGIWGMNFPNMLELTIPNAYPVAIGIIVASGLAVYVYFRRTGWFD